MGPHIDYDAIPGTVHLVDVDHDMLTADHAKGKNKDIVLVPKPSEDPEDPLNWTPYRKYLATFCMVVYTFGVGVPSAAIYSVLTPISESNGITLSQLNSGTGYMFLFFGLGGLIFQPLALQYGKRPVYLFSCLATTLIMLWSPYAKDNGQWIGAHILQGLLGSPIESLPENTIADLFFSHEISRFMGSYSMSLIISNFIAPLVAGFIATGQGWRWVLYWCSIFSAVCTVFLFFFMEETQYHREVNTTNESYDQDDAEEKLGNVRVNIQEKTSPVPYAPKTFKQKLKLISYNGKGERKFLMWEYFKGPFILLRYPTVLWCGFLYGSSLVLFNILNATTSLVFGSAPYNFSASMVGLTYVSPIIFALLSYFLAGTLSDWLKINLAKRRGGMSEAEDRLWSLSVYTILGPAGLILYGVGASKDVHWFGLVVGMGMVGGLGVLGCSAPVTYCLDCVHEVSTEAMALVIVIRNCMSFAISYGITPWIEQLGYQNCFISACFIFMFCLSSFLLMIATGKYWRIKTKSHYWNWVSERRAKGIYA